MKLRERFSAAMKVFAAGATSMSASDLWQAILRGNGVSTSSGKPVTDNTAMQVSTLVACLQVISGSITQLPVDLYRKGKDGYDEKLPVSNLWWLLNESPYPGWTAASWKEWIVLCIALRGDSHALIIRDTRVGSPSLGAIKGFLPLHPDQCSARRHPDTGLVVYDIALRNGTKTYAAEDVLHFPGFGFDGLKSYSLIQWAAKSALGNALAANDYAGRTFKEGAMPQILLKYPKKMEPTQAEVVRESFNKIYGGTDGRKFPLVLPEGADARELSLTPEDAQLLQTRAFEKDEICEAAGVPPILIGRSEKVSAWGTGIEQITLGFVRFRIKPELKRWSEELNRKIYSRAPNYLRFDLTELLAGDSKAQAEFFKAALGGPGAQGWMTPDEVRRRFNLPPLPNGEGAKLAGAGKAAEPAKPADPTDPADPNEPKE
jgi:HK97 family phage portal protein